MRVLPALLRGGRLMRKFAHRARDRLTLTDYAIVLLYALRYRLASYERLNLVTNSRVRASM